MLCGTNKTTVWCDKSCLKEPKEALCPAAANTASVSWNRHAGKQSDRNLIWLESGPELHQSPT